MARLIVGKALTETSLVKTNITKKYLKIQN